jgi:hypothetical protein
MKITKMVAQRERERERESDKHHPRRRVIGLIIAIFALGTGFIITNHLSQIAHSASESGTSIPVKKGGTGATTAGGALQNLLPSYTDNNGRVLGLANGAPSWVEQTDSYMFPDYANQVELADYTFYPTSLFNEITESPPLIMAESGYVRIYYQVAAADPGLSNTSGSAQDWVNVVMRVNGVSVFDDQTASYYNPISRTFPVKKDDVVTMGVVSFVDRTIGWQSGGRIWFIPPVYSTPTQPIVVDAGVGGSYLLNEVQTADKWLDGRPIYKQTFQTTTPASINSGKTAILMPAGTMRELIKAETLLTTTDNMTSSSLILYTANGDMRYSINVFRQTGDTDLRVNIFLPSTSLLTYTNSQVYITAYYTKLVD